MVFGIAYSESIVFAGAVFFLVLIGVYVYLGFAWMHLAQRMNHPRPWLAWIPFANLALWLDMGKMRWQWVFLLVGLFLPIKILNLIVFFIVLALILVAHWRVFEQVNYPGWLCLVILVDWIAGGIGTLAYLIVLGFVVWKRR